MIAKFKVEGTIELELDDEMINNLNQRKSTTMKNAYLEEELRNAFYSCAMTYEHEFDGKIDFDGLFVKTNPDKAELEIKIEPTALTKKEIIAKTMREISERKGKTTKHWN